MTLVNAYLFVFNILDGYWDEIQESWNEDDKDALGGTLTEMSYPNLEHDENRVYTLDPAPWIDWLEAVKKVTPNDRITEKEAKNALREFLKEYKRQGIALDKTIEYVNRLVDL